MLANKTVTLKLWGGRFEIAKGFENGAGAFSVVLFDLSMWKEWRYISFVQITAWIVSFSIGLDLS